MKLLVVDDDENTIKLITKVLSKNSFNVLTANDGNAAIEAALSKKPEMILMDVNMPVTGGLTASKTLREKGYNGVITAFTATMTERSMDYMKDYGIDAVITKPIPDNFGQRLKKIYSEHKRS